MKGAALSFAKGVLHHLPIPRDPELRVLVRVVLGELALHALKATNGLHNRTAAAAQVALGSKLGHMLLEADWNGPAPLETHGQWPVQWVGGCILQQRAALDQEGQGLQHVLEQVLHRRIWAGVEPQEGLMDKHLLFEATPGHRLDTDNYYLEPVLKNF